MIKMIISTISESMVVIYLSKVIWYEWAQMYRYESNISRTIDIYEQLFMMK